MNLQKGREIKSLARGMKMYENVSKLITILTQVFEVLANLQLPENSNAPGDKN